MVAQAKPASKRQLWALFCATKEDHRDKNLTYEQAHDLLSKANAGRTRWTESKVLDVIREARQAGRTAADAKFAELQSKGPKWAVCEETAPFSGVTSKVVGTMLDVCGNAHLKIPARGKFYLLAKKLSANSAYRFYCRKGYYGGGTLSIFDSTNRQEMSVNEVAAHAQADILEKYGIKANVESRID